MDFHEIGPILAIMLTDCFVELVSKGFGSNRVLDTLFRLIKANARLKLKELADEQDAREIIQFYNVVMLEYQQVVSIPRSPRDVAYNESISVLKEIQAAISLEELMKVVCERNEFAKRYL